MTVSQREINYVSPALVVMCVCYKTVYQQRHSQHCLHQLHANGWLLSVMLHFNVSSIRVETAVLLSHTPLQGSLQQSITVSNDHQIPPCVSKVLRYLVLNNYSVHLCGVMAGSCLPIVAVDLCLIAGSLCPLRHITL